MNRKKISHPEGIRTAFIRTLIEDVLGAMKMHDSSGSQPYRRQVIRALFAAIEGMTWEYREHVVNVARSCDHLTVKEEMAFSEVSYSVTPQGKIVELARFVPLLAMFRLTTKLAERMDSELEVDFSGSGWKSLRQAIEIRNRITHPKSNEDLEVKEHDLAVCWAGFDWHFELCLAAMASANAAFRDHTEALGAILEKLKEGDPDTIAAYNAAAKAIWDS